jgi:hypothetical protein
MSSAETELEQFLGDPKQKVLALQGPWGIGKTFFWKDFIQRKLAIVKERAYSYVSLFGASSVDQAKNMIVAGAGTTGAKKYSPVLTVSQQVQKLKRFIKDVEVPVPYGKQAGALLSNILSNVQESLIRDCLICFDDLERKSNAVPMSEIMGLISTLKEHRDCRIVVIYNQDQFAEEDRKDYDRFREKVVDRWLSYAPALRSNLSLIFSAEEIGAFESIFRDLPLNNIRVMQQAKWALEYFEPHLSSYYPNLQSSFRSQVVKIACLYHGFSEMGEIEKVAGHSWILEAIDSTTERLPYVEILRRIEFSSEPYDNEIIFFLKNGYCDVERLTSVLQGLNDQYEDQEAAAEARAIWDLIRDNFQADVDKVISEAKRVLDRRCTSIALDFLKETVALLKMVDTSTDWDFYVKKAVLNWVRKADEESLSRLERVGSSPEIGAAVAKRRRELVEKLKIGDLLEAVAGSDSWNPKDYSRLNQFSSDEFLKFFRETDKNNLLRLLRTLDERLARETSPDAVSLRSKVGGALTTIASESKLNSFRVEKVLGQTSSAEQTPTVSP